MLKPKDIQLIGTDIAIAWEDGSESYLTSEYLRRNSPSAENVGEVDILGQRHGGAHTGQEFSGVTVVGWNFVGNYGIQFTFSDHHRTGIYSYTLLQKLAQETDI